MKARVRRLLLVLAAAALLLDGGLLLAERLGAASLPEEDTAYFLDVGEGDCTLLVSGGSTVLVDAGTPEGAPALVRELKSLGVRRLDAVIATHPHADHIGGGAPRVSRAQLLHGCGNAERRAECGAPPAQTHAPRPV